MAPSRRSRSRTHIWRACGSAESVICGCSTNGRGRGNSFAKTAQPPPNQSAASSPENPAAGRGHVGPGICGLRASGRPQGIALRVSAHERGRITPDTSPTTSRAGLSPAADTGHHRATDSYTRTRRSDTAGRAGYSFAKGISPGRANPYRPDADTSPRNRESNAACSTRKAARNHAGNQTGQRLQRPIRSSFRRWQPHLRAAGGRDHHLLGRTRGRRASSGGH